MKKSQNITFQTRKQRFTSKFFSSYYGSVTKDLQIITVFGTHLAPLTAQLIHQILLTANQRSALLSSKTPLKASVLHKFFNHAWKTGATHTVVVASPESLSRQVFHGLPLKLVTLTDFQTSDPLHDLSPIFTLLENRPKLLAINSDHFDDLSSLPKVKSTLTFGKTPDSDLHLITSKLYKKGSEAKFSLNDQHFTIASFLNQEEAITAMTAATAAALALGIKPEIIAEGIADFETSNS